MTRAGFSTVNARLDDLLHRLAVHHVDTWQHSQRVGRLACALAAETGLAGGLGGDLAGGDLALAASLHDIGKLRLPLRLMDKPGGLTVAEQERVRQHTADGAALLMAAGASVSAVAIARSHHECWDGSGYPMGLRGAAIPLAARLVSIVDVYDALRSARAYKPGRPRGEAMTEMSRMRERFDPELLAAFCNAETAMDATYRAAGGR